MDAELQTKYYMIAYEGHKRIDIENFKIEDLNSLRQLSLSILKKLEYRFIGTNLANLPKLSLEEIRSKAKEFCLKYFKIHDINYVPMKSIIEEQEKVIASSDIDKITADDMCKIINSLIRTISPFDLDVELVDGCSFYGKIVKPLPILTKLESSPERKMYFSNIELGKQLTPLSIGTLVHEIAHAEQEHNIGYAEDYLNREVISIFLEKIAAMEIDPTGNLLKLSERIRFSDIIMKYNKLMNNSNSLTELEKIDSIMYIKSLLYAEKLFDLYIDEKRQQKKDKYFYGIQDVFDGKITVEEMLKNRNVTAVNCQELRMLKRHF